MNSDLYDSNIIKPIQKAFRSTYILILFLANLRIRESRHLKFKIEKEIQQSEKQDAKQNQDIIIENNAKVGGLSNI